ncbi:hypothetical protein L0664_00065 [Octadecabacter sp. G9-8]|uniref:Uncharacterized protein n=1 Tax=Octadecabacter dasysiphoniae TaxID=2909341 RepID=A0ABS9CQE1_9RHOB|nr:hypothetical protein [Octadecabacter dasysiphoniae]MCF2869449.1 hypothetical protein [Octadecabacter dasysiphoniae]
MLAILALIGIGLAGAMAIDIAEEAEPDRDDNDVDDIETTGADLLDNLGQISPEPETVLIDGIEFSSDFLENGALFVGDDEDSVLDGQSGEAMNSQDHLFGGNGNDHLIGGHNDILVGGDGVDLFEIGLDSEVHVLDLEDDELLVIQYIGQPPTITGDASDDGITILANGYPVAQLDEVYHINFDQVALRKVG